MLVCTFFGHRECYGLNGEVLRSAVEDRISKGVDTFYVGNQGQFDSMVYSYLKQLRKEYPYIQICVVLAYLPAKKSEYDDMADTMYPEIEGHPKFAIERRNRWMIEVSDYCLCYINHTWGGAYKFSQLAKRRGKTVINIGNIEIGGQQ